MTDPISMARTAGFDDITTGTGGAIVSTAEGRLASALRNPQSITGKAPDDPLPSSGINTGAAKGVDNPYGMSLSAYEPNTSPYIEDLAASKTGSASPTLDTLQQDYSSANADVQQSQQEAANLAAATRSGGNYAQGGVVDASGKVQGLVNAALQLAARNVPYVWGGSSATGVDCSGLIYYAAQAAGIKDWKRYVANDYGRMGAAVSMQDARPGDIVYYNGGASGSGEGHVGIYVGNGMMVAAPQSGENVKIQKVYGQPTSIRRIFTDSSFGPVATPTGGTSYNYNGQTWSTSIGNGAAAVAGGLSSVFGGLFGNHRAGTAQGAEPGTAGYSGGTLGGNLRAAVPYANLFTSAQARYGVPASLLAAVAHQESGFNPNARSRVGAAGLMQFMPTTAKGLGVNTADPASSVDGAARMLAGLRNQFGSWELALAAYNAGSGNVRKYGGIPPFAETQHYVSNITALAQRYSQ